MPATQPSDIPALRTLEWPQAQGGVRTLTLQERAGAAVLSDTAHEFRLPVAAAQVLAIGLVPPGVAERMAARQAPVLTLSGTQGKTGFVPDSLELADDPVSAQAPAPGLPLHTALLPRLQASAFGREGRAAVQGVAGQGVLLACSAGTAAAGALLQGVLAAPLQGRTVALRLRMRGSGIFGIAVADGERLQTEDPLALDTVRAGDGWAHVDIPLPALAWQPDDWRAVTITCPAGAAQLDLADLQLVLADQPPASRRHALWVWRPAAWRDDAPALLAHLQDNAAADVFVSVPLLDEACTGQACAVADAAQLSAFLRSAAASGVRVWAVAGDPRAVLPEERAAWIGRAAAYRQFNLAQPPAARLAGVQYDIEAYLVPGYGEDPAGWNQRYVDLLRRLREAGGNMAMDVVVPWWFGRGGDSPAELLTALQPLVDILTVMDYRTDGDQLVQAAVPFVAWAQHGGRQVRIALESGPLPDLEARRYEAAAQGELLVLELGNQTVYALLATTLAAGPRAQVFARRGGHLVKAAQTTFAGRPEALRLAVLHLEDAFAATRAFAGVAMHGLDQAWY